MCYHLSSQNGNFLETLTFQNLRALIVMTFIVESVTFQKAERFLASVSFLNLKQQFNINNNKY